MQLQEKMEEVCNICWLTYSLEYRSVVFNNRGVVLETWLLKAIGGITVLIHEWAFKELQPYAILWWRRLF